MHENNTPPPSSPTPPTSTEPPEPEVLAAVAITGFALGLLGDDEYPSIRHTIQVAQGLERALLGVMAIAPKEIREAAFQRTLERLTANWGRACEQWDNRKVEVGHGN
jgi:hypothetical protein